MRATKLRKMADIRRLLARIINQLDADKITESKARGMGYLCNILRDVIECSELESRIALLEKQMDKEKEC
jgi:uncharacterized protein YutE (UPF0331/DUF86 family)